VFRIENSPGRKKFKPVRFEKQCKNIKKNLGLYINTDLPFLIKATYFHDGHPLLLLLLTYQMNQRILHQGIILLIMEYQGRLSVGGFR
jgi:hypothetical protein